MFVRWLLIAQVVVIAMSAFYAGVNASYFAPWAHHQGLVVGVLVTLAVLVGAIGVIWRLPP